MFKKLQIIGIISIILCFAKVKILAQQDSIYSSIQGSFYLDEIVVSAMKKGFDIADFIALCEQDESFYRSFRNLRFINYDADNEILIFKKKKLQTYHKSKTHQWSDGACRQSEFAAIEEGNKYRKRNNELRFYTAKMFHRLFFTPEKFCDDPKKISFSEKSDLSGMEEKIQELKKLIFQPGKKIDIPIIGNKTAIFDKKMRKYYDYAILSKRWKKQFDCYVFRVSAKQGIEKNKTVVKYMDTYFEKATLQVVGRNYFLEHQNLAFDFDVKMTIELTKIGEKYYPKMLKYNGEWDVPLKRPEKVKFKADFSNFVLAK